MSQSVFSELIMVESVKYRRLRVCRCSSFHVEHIFVDHEGHIILSLSLYCMDVCNDRFSLLSVTLYGVFTNHSCMGVATRCLLLELLDVSVSELLVRGNSGTQGGR